MTPDLRIVRANGRPAPVPPPAAQAVAARRYDKSRPDELAEDYHAPLAGGDSAPRDWGRLVRRAIVAGLLAAVVLAAAAIAARAATIAELPGPFPGGAGWRPEALTLDMVTASGPCGTGGAVIGDGCAPVVAAGQPQLAAYGQDARGGINWQDMPGLTIDLRAPARGVTFVLADFHDQSGSFGTIRVGDSVFHTLRGENANRRTFLVLAEEGEMIERIHLATRRNDGATALGLQVCR